jgi:hypothetical protein
MKRHVIKVIGIRAIFQDITRSNSGGIGIKREVTPRKLMGEWMYYSTILDLGT